MRITWKQSFWHFFCVVFVPWVGEDEKLFKKWKKKYWKSKKSKTSDLSGIRSKTKQQKKDNDNSYSFIHEKTEPADVTSATTTYFTLKWHLFFPLQLFPWFFHFNMNRTKMLKSVLFYVIDRIDWDIWIKKKEKNWIHCVS